MRHLQKVDHAACGASFRVGATKNHSSQPDMYDRAGTHGARLFSDVQITIVKPPIADGAFGLGDSQHFGVSRGIFERLNLVPGAADNFAFGYDNGADRNLFCGPGFSSLAQSFAHKIGVTRKIQHFQRCLAYRAQKTSENERERARNERERRERGKPRQIRAAFPFPLVLGDLARSRSFFDAPG